MDYLEDAMRNLEEREALTKGTVADGPEKRYPDDDSRVWIGRITKFFGKINVAAIELTASLRVGDEIEIVNEGSTVRQRVASMQINRTNVMEAGNGDDVGIKIDGQVAEGSSVYRIK
jgi:translation initiation factor IF-2